VVKSVRSAIPSGFFVLRTPLLPVDVFTDWSEGLRAPAAQRKTRADLEAALEADRKMLAERLREIVAEPEIRQALFAASPSLDTAIDAYLKEPGSRRTRGVESSLVRYLARMTGRPTPFGLFAGSSVGRLAAATRLRLGPRQGYRSHTRLDMAYLCALAEALSRDASTREHLSFYPNSGLYTLGARLHYASWHADPASGARAYRLEALEPSEPLKATLERSAGGARLQTLARALTEDHPDVSVEEARTFVDELADIQLLVSNLEPSVTGKQPLEDVLAALVAADVKGGVAFRTLDEARRTLAELDAQGLGVDPARYRELAAKLEALPGQAALSRLYQVDLHKAAPGATLSARVVDEIVAGVELAHQLCQRELRPDLRRFRDEFLRRYGDREVPLVEALDESAGIGFGAPAPHESDTSSLLSELPFSRESDREVPWNRRERFLFRKLCETLQSGAHTLELEKADFEELESSEARPLPSALAASVTLISSSESDLDHGDFEILWHGAFGPSGAINLARFCHGDPALLTWVEQHLAQEEAGHPDVVFAEIAHLPQGRAANIVCRPVLRGHEIPYYGRSGVDPDSQISVSDLRVSVVEGRIVLRSARLNREVVPRLSTAHDPSGVELGVYRFLSFLQVQGVASSLQWTWGPLGNAPFTPRVRIGRLILARARWQLGSADLAPLAAGDGALRYRAVQELRERRRLPRWVAVGEADQLLPLDLHNALCIDVLADLGRRASALSLTEVLPGSGSLCVTGPEGSFTHDLLIPLVPAPGTPTARLGLRATQPPIFEATRSFPPGSEWLFAKIYTSAAHADAVLLEAVAPVVDEARASGDADAWFFIRYADPDPHLRVRLHGPPTELLNSVWPALRDNLNPHMRDGSVRVVQLDCYERELERYGGDEGIELAEALFQIDSDFALAVLPALQDGTGEARWRVALVAVDQLLNDLGLDLPTRTRVVADFLAGLKREFEIRPEFEHALGRKYRVLRSELTELMAPSVAAEPHALAGLRDAFEVRSSRIGEIRSGLEARARSGALTQSMESLAMSFVHMAANRLFPSAPRANELVLYDFLIRQYRSDLARSRAE
jgi:thiopeptide-type bacteriocin biosynthesis protein